VIVIVDVDAAGLLDCLAEVRAAGRAVLVADPRWSAVSEAVR